MNIIPPSRLVVFFAAGVTLSMLDTPAGAETPEIKELRPFLEKHCVGCHGPDKQKGDFHIDQLKATETGEDAETWQLVLEKLQDGEMPPEDEPQPSVAELEPVTTWINNELERARQLLANASPQSVLRRLGRYEYENTLRDLFHLSALPVADLIPADTKHEAFDNNGRFLDIGNSHLHGYLDAIDAAIHKAGVWDRSGRLLKNPYEKQTKIYGLVPEKIDEKAFNENLARHSSRLNSIAPLPHARRTSYFNSYVFKPPYEGTYRIRLVHFLHKLDRRRGDVVVKSRSPNSDVSSRVVDVFWIEPGSAENPQTYEIELYLTRDEQVVFTVESPARTNGLPGWNQRFKTPAESKAYFEKGRPEDEYRQAVEIIEENRKMGCWAIMSEETEGPLEYRDQWPPESHTALYGNRKNRGDITETEVVDTIRQFVPRAFRRPVTTEESGPFLELVRNEIADHDIPPHEALEVGFRSILTSPQVLYLRESSDHLSQYELASRLSYFLWSTLPDDPLLAAAENGKLSGPGLSTEVNRMLNDPRSRALEDRFLTLWLDLDLIEDTNPDAVLFPEFTPTIRQLMLQETKRFFREMLEKDLSVMNVIDSDWTMLNEELARYYGITGVEGYEFRKVALKPEHHRGGMITHGSVLKVTANGTETSPVIRGVWLLDRILGTPVPPPPVAPPAITPDTRGAVTVREQLARHRDDPSCMDCHKKIDPLGFALESYDPAGSFRDFYRTTSDTGTPVKAAAFRGLRDTRTLNVKYKQGREVEVGGRFPDGKSFGDINEFQNLLVQQKETVAENVVRQLLTFALGRDLGFTDEETVARIMANTESGNHGLRSLVHEVTQSEAFQKK